ncbi:PaaX family transcriptional regulator C-terminal domain-containing protein [Streptomyces sp. NPDC097619]|uniref:PaaX family transcriptional regulator C-terminal domain-containing protein n=1 Tax=Streptomyces sp. NPDC097619 TaxID=3157228 RepID=UPI0033263E36
MTTTEIPTRLLVHALVREDGTVDAGELYGVAEALGMTDQQVRLCVRRLAAEGRFTQEGRGRRAVLRATGTAADELAADVGYVELAYAQDRGEAPWDGNWHLFAFAVPESRRAARDGLREALTGLGAAPVQGGLYVSPHAIGPFVAEAAERLGLGDSLTTASSRDLRVAGRSEPGEVAAVLWPLEETAGRYGELSDLAAVEGRDPLVHAVELAAAFSRAMRPDPLLPPELLPHPWPGSTARAAAAGAWNRLLAAEPVDAGGPRLRLFAAYGESVRAAAGA